MDKKRMENESILRERDQEGVLYTNSYPVYLKTIKGFYTGEAIACEIEKEIPGFFSNSSSVNKQWIIRDNHTCFKRIINKIKEIYLSGKKQLLEENDGIKLYEVFYQDYYYFFLTDMNDEKKVIILTDIVTEQELETEDVILTGDKNDEFIKENPSNFWKTDHYIIINTFNAFCLYAMKIRNKMNKKMNAPFFNEIKNDLAAGYDNKIMNPRYGVEKHACQYVVFKNYVIVYLLSENLPEFLFQKEDVRFAAVTEWREFENPDCSGHISSEAGIEIKFQITGESEKRILSDQRWLNKLVYDYAGSPELYRGMTFDELYVCICAGKDDGLSERYEHVDMEVYSKSHGCFDFTLQSNWNNISFLEDILEEHAKTEPSIDKCRAYNGEYDEFVIESAAYALRLIRNEQEWKFEPCLCGGNNSFGLGDDIYDAMAECGALDD